ncbi:MAG: hypothetical protein EU544_02865 [Promethearchaeota archaeon]|nr:MAG: hypothetical protein EU544_02865 [Candidatus Lokiarchaeota archaeon]
MTENDVKEKEGEQDSEEMKDLFTKVQKGTKDLIDEIKNELKDQSEDQKVTLGTVIEEAIGFYSSFYKLPSELEEIVQKFEAEYGGKTELLKEALRIFNIYKKKRLDLWLGASEDLHMMLIGRTTFRNLLFAGDTAKKSLDKPQKENNAIDVILWHLKKPITQITLKEILQTIQEIWVLFNFFTRVEITEENEDTYYVRFIHGEDERYSRYYLGYFEILFRYLNESKDVPFKCAVEGQAFGQTVSLTIRELFEKNNNL